MKNHQKTGPARIISLWTLIPIVVVLLVMTGTASASSPPEFKLKDINGHWLTLKDHIGKEVIYLDFWATWCVPCRRELPHLQKMYSDFSGDGFLIIGINTDPAASKSKIKPYLRRYKITFPTVLDPDNNVLDKYNPTRELPYGVLIDLEGNVHEIYAGYRAGDELRLLSSVKELLKKRPAQSGTVSTSE